MTSMEPEVPRNFFTYWSGNELSSLNIATVRSFLFHHPDDRLIIYSSRKREGLVRLWTTKEQEENLDSGLPLSDLEMDSRVEVRYVDLKQKFNLPDDLSANHIGDMVRILVLANEGGIWLDLDIIFIKSIPTACFEFKGEVLATTYGGTIACGVVFAKPRSNFLNLLSSELFKRLETDITTNYQSVGPDLWRDFYRNNETQRQALVFFSPKIFYPYMPQKISEFFHSVSEARFAETIGIHWYNGARVSREFIKNYCLRELSLEKIPSCPARFALELGGVGLSFNELLHSTDEVNNADGVQEFTFTQSIKVSNSLRNVQREKFFLDLCRDKRVLHIGCADSPITNVANNLHLRLEGVASVLHGHDLDTKALELIYPHLKRRSSLLFNNGIDELVGIRYDVLLAPEVIEHVGSLESFVRDLESIDFSLGVITAPCAFQCRETHFNYADITGDYVELVHPDHNCWFTPYTLGNVIRKYSKLECIKTGFIDKHSVFVVVKKSPSSDNRNLRYSS